MIFSKNKNGSTLKLSEAPSISFLKTLSISLLVFFDFFKGFLRVRLYEKSVSIFGSARESLDPKFYEEAELLGALFVKQGFAVVTGGNGGIMRSANKGAQRAKGNSVGITVKFDGEPAGNKFLTRTVVLKYFFTRKTLLSCASEIYVFFPGGYGTLDELFEMLTLIQTGYSECVPIVLYGKNFWDPLVEFLDTYLAKEFKTISEFDTKRFVILDSVEEVERYVQRLNITNSRSCKVGYIPKM